MYIPEHNMRIKTIDVTINEEATEILYKAMQCMDQQNILHVFDKFINDETKSNTVKTWYERRLALAEDIARERRAIKQAIAKLTEEEKSLLHIAPNIRYSLDTE